MEHNKISKRLVIKQYVVIKQFKCIKVCDKKWIGLKGLASGQYYVIKTVRFQTTMLISDLCDYSEAYIVVKGRNKKLLFKNNVSFRSCIAKISNLFIDITEDFDIVIHMYNLLEYS